MQPTPILRPRQSPSRLLIGFASLVVVVLVMATTSPAWAALARGEATVQDRADPAASATVVRPPVAPVIGVWQRRDAWLWVFEDGTARLRWRTEWCEPDTRAPCDRVDERGLTVGASAEMSVPDVRDAERATLEGQVVAMNAPGPMQIGSVSLSRVAEDLVVLRQGDRTLVLCRPPRDLNFCDASEN